MADSTATAANRADDRHDGPAAFSSRPALAAIPGLGLVAAAFFVESGLLAMILLGSGAAIVFVVMIALAVSAWRRRMERRDAAALTRFVEHDTSPGFLTDAEGEIRYQNETARDRFGDQSGQTLAHALRDNFANPGAIIYRLQTRAAAQGAAREDIVTRRGHIRLAVHQVGESRFLWRLEDMGLRNMNSRGAETLSLPMLTASRSGTILFMNEAMRTLVGGRVKTLDRVFNELPVKSGQENVIASAEGPIRTLVAELEGPGGRREIYLLPGGEGGLSHDGSWQFFDQLPVPLMKIAPGGRVLLANRRARRLLDYTEGQGEEVFLSDLVEGLGRPIGEWLREAASGRGLSRSEVLQARRPEQEVFLQFSLSRVMEDGAPVLIAVLTDATELKTLEAQFVQSQKMQAIGQLAGGVAHDFNNLLTAISGHCDLLLLRHDQDDMDYADLMQIHQNANRAASLVGQLLAFSRKQNLRPEVLDLRETLSDLTHLLNRLVGEKVTLSFSHDPGLHPIRADKRQLEQVLMNLVVNARDAMPEGGEIRIETFDTTLREPLMRDRATVPPGKYVVVKVSDQGIGIAPDKINKVFEPFYTTKRTGEGTGLGLSTAYGIVKQTGGFIFVDSVPGNGTCFTLYFPACEVQAAEPPAPGAEREASGPVAAGAAMGRGAGSEIPATGKAGEAAGDFGHPASPSSLDPASSSLSDTDSDEDRGGAGDAPAAGAGKSADREAGNASAEEEAPDGEEGPGAPFVLTGAMGGERPAEGPRGRGGEGPVPGSPPEGLADDSEGPADDDAIGIARFARHAAGRGEEQSGSERPPGASEAGVLPAQDAQGAVLEGMLSRAEAEDAVADVLPDVKSAAETAATADPEGEEDSVSRALAGILGAQDGDAAPQQGGQPPGGQSEAVVLLVEDEAPVRAFASRALRMRGFTVLEAESAEEALDILDQSDLSVDIFVTDVIMPGMDGPSWVRKALEKRPGVKVVFVSGYAEDDFSENQARIPNSVFLPKPFSLSELTSTVQQQLH